MIGMLVIGDADTSGVFLETALDFSSIERATTIWVVFLLPLSSLPTIPLFLPPPPSCFPFVTPSKDPIELLAFLYTLVGLLTLLWPLT